ncbi:helix-turn-helix domain-containing protein [Caldimonas brevitalea]|uniref:Transcriptional regulator n=1 Tax=Caldimonas brevitalea TaxID=413882 RepID=A0A0G3BPR6_9BURK|nr:helix-turn-helix transcriptional regulator [Caldimonas brevitalea]AKJ31424.1 transcriptional regulator [Caldimonas brevitalea]
MDNKQEPDDSGARASAHLARNLTSLRHARRLTQDALATASALPRSTIANLESGEANPSLAVLVKVAGALGVPIDELLAAPRAKVRKWSARDIGVRVRGRGVTERDLLPEPVPDEMMSVMDFEPGGVLGGTPHLPGTREFFTCLDGRVTLFVAGESYELDSGEVLAFPGNVRHSYQNPDAQRPARGVSVVVFAKAGV